MSQVNLFKIQDGREAVFLKFVGGQYKTVAEATVKGFKFKLLWQESSEQQDVNWGWAFSIFKKPIGQMTKMPKGIIVVREINAPRKTYAISFGGAHFHIDPYCDREFGFEFACRVKVCQTKLTSTINNNSKKNKTINSFKDFDHLEINSGESYTKLKLGIDAERFGFLANRFIEVGTSIKTSLKNDSFDNLIQLIKSIEQTLAGERLTRIPVCNIVRKQEEIEALDKRLHAAFLKEDSTVTISEFDVIGVDEVFVRADSFELLCGRNSKRVDSLNMDELRSFFSESGIGDVETMLKTRVRFMANENSQVIKPIRNYIDYLDESGKALLVCGKWYRFNSDFCQCLKESLEDIRVVYDPRFDLCNTLFEQFWDAKAKQHKKDKQYQGLAEDSLHAAICKRYYKEYAFNLMRADEGFEICDRKTVDIHGEKIEICDLRKDGAIYSVKRGNSSADLSYVVTQSEAAIDSYANHALPKSDRPHTVVLWLIFPRKDHLPIQEERLNWDKLGMLLLKMRIDSWKKKARSAGMTPEIRINYELSDR